MQITIRWVNDLGADVTIRTGLGSVQRVPALGSVELIFDADALEFEPVAPVPAGSPDDPVMLVPPTRPDNRRLLVTLEPETEA